MFLSLYHNLEAMKKKRKFPIGVDGQWHDTTDVTIKRDEVLLVL